MVRLLLLCRCCGGTDDAAADGEGENSIYCQALAKYLLYPDIEIEHVFKNVRREVSEISQGRQNPEVLSKLNCDVYLNKTTQVKKDKLNLSKHILDNFLGIYHSAIKSKNLEISARNFLSSTRGPPAKGSNGTPGKY